MLPFEAVNVRNAMLAMKHNNNCKINILQTKIMVALFATIILVDQHQVEFDDSDRCCHEKKSNE